MKQDRVRAFRRQWRTLVLLREHRRTVEDLAAELGVTTRTVRRDLAIFRAVPLPVRKVEAWRTPALWFLGSMLEWPRNECVPVKELPPPAEVSVQDARSHGE